MSKRWIRGLLSKTKRGLASLFVCAVVLFPLISFGWLVIQATANADKRSDKPLPAFSTRSIDSKSTPPKLFAEPLVSVTFDDGWESTYSVAGPLLQKYGIRSTQYILSGTLKDSNYLSSKQIKSLINGGQEIACHSVDHPDLTSLENSDLNFQLTECQTTLEHEFGVKTTDFASPYGHSNTRTIKAIHSTYRSHRNTDGDITNGVNEADVNTAGTFNTLNIIGVTVRRDTPAWQIKEAIDYTVAHNGWLVITYHQIDEGPSKFGLDSKLLEEQLAIISKSNVKIAPVGEILTAYNKGNR